MVFPPALRAFYTKIAAKCRQLEIIAGKSGRHMKYPYTMSAKIAQFPYLHYLNNNNIWMYFPLGFIVAFYFIGQIHAIVNSDENVKSWAETQRRMAEKEHH